MAVRAIYSRPAWVLAAAIVALAPDPAPAGRPVTSPRPALLLSDSRRFVAQDAWDSVALYDGAHRVRRFPLRGHARLLDVSADDRHLAAGTYEGIGVWDLGTGERRWWKRHGETGVDSVYDASFSRDGNSLILCGASNSATVWEAGTGQLRATLTVPDDGASIHSACLSPDGSRAALVGGPDHLFAADVGSGAVRDTGVTGGGPVRYSPDGKSVAFRSNNSWQDEAVRVVAIGPGGAISSEKDIGRFSHVGHIRPADGGGFLACGWLGDRYRERGFSVGTRIDPAAGSCEELWRLEGASEDTLRVDFRADSLRGVATDWRLVTSVFDLRKGGLVLRVDNSASASPGLLSWHTPAGRSSIGLIALCVAAAGAVVLWRLRRSRSNAPRGGRP